MSYKSRKITVMKIETEIMTSIEASQIGRAMIVVVIVLISNIIMYLTAVISFICIFFLNTQMNMYNFMCKFKINS
jgi:hypothetical protein